MWTRTSKEFIEMKKQTTKEIFDLCASAYVETSTHQKISYPRWIEEITNDREDAERGFVAIQAWLLAENMPVKVKDQESTLQPIEEARVRALTVGALPTICRMPVLPVWMLIKTTCRKSLLDNS